MSTNDHEDPVAVGIGKNGEGYHSRGHDTQVPQTLDDVGRENDTSIFTAQSVVCGEGQGCVHKGEYAETERSKDGGIDGIDEDGRRRQGIERQEEGVQLNDELRSRDEGTVKEAKESGVSANVRKTASLAKDGQVDQLAIAGEREREREREREGREGCKGKKSGSMREKAN